MRDLHSLILSNEQRAQERKKLKGNRYSIQPRTAGKYLLIIRHLHTSIPVYRKIIEADQKTLNTQKYMNFRNLLNLEVELTDCPKMTIRSYLQNILSRVWEERECGKRPFGHSDWEYKKGYVNGTEKFR